MHLPEYRQPITARDLARLLGVSQSAVSRAFTAGASISPKMRARILTVAEKHDYRPNTIASILSKRRSNIVGLVFSDLQNPFYPALIEKLSRSLQQVGQQCLLFNVTPGSDMRQQLTALRQYSVDAAVVLVSAAVLPTAELSAATEGRTTILVNRTAPGSSLLSVSCDNIEGARAIADHFYALGHRRVAFLGGRPGSITDAERRDAFAARLAELGMVLTAGLSAGEFSYRAGHAAAAQIVGARSTDAVFCVTDIVAAGAMDALRGAFGVAVPDALSIAGFDDIDMASWPHYALTTFRYPVDAVVGRIVRLLVDGEGTSCEESNDHRLPGELVVRATTGPRPRRGQRSRRV